MVLKTTCECAWRCTWHAKLFILADAIYFIFAISILVHNFAFLEVAIYLWYQRSMKWFQSCDILVFHAYILLYTFYTILICDFQFIHACRISMLNLVLLSHKILNMMFQSGFAIWNLYFTDFKDFVANVSLKSVGTSIREHGLRSFHHCNLRIKWNYVRTIKPTSSIMINVFLFKCRQVLLCRSIYSGKMNGTLPSFKYHPTSRLVFLYYAFNAKN